MENVNDGGLISAQDLLLTPDDDMGLQSDEDELDDDDAEKLHTIDGPDFTKETKLDKKFQGKLKTFFVNAIG